MMNIVELGERLKAVFYLLTARLAQIKSRIEKSRCLCGSPPLLGEPPSVRGGRSGRWVGPPQRRQRNRDHLSRFHAQIVRLGSQVVRLRMHIKQGLDRCVRVELHNGGHDIHGFRIDTGRILLSRHATRV